MFEHKEDFIAALQGAVLRQFGRPYEEATDLERYQALVGLLVFEAHEREYRTDLRCKKESLRRVCYFSMDYLLGRLLAAYLMNLGLTELVREGLRELHTELDSLLEQERDPGFGSGGLGRLAACYLDSMAFEGLMGCGYGLFYKSGQFKQRIVNGRQVELPDDWLENGYPWASRRPEQAVAVRFGGCVEFHPGKTEGEYDYEWEPEETVLAVPNEIPIIGYGGETVNRLTLWSAHLAEDTLDLEAFDRGDYAAAIRARARVKALTQFLYPNDSTPAGRELRLKQEYLLSAAGVCDIVRRYRREYGTDWESFPKRIAIHINDTHPTLCAPELLRILLDEENLSWDLAWAIVTKTITYTNHTVMPEALEEWPIELMKRILPRVYMIIEEIDRRFGEKLSQDTAGREAVLSRTAILWDGRVRMTNLAVIVSNAVNGVSALHSEILKGRLLRDFGLLMPEKFQNKTNGVAHRRFLAAANPGLSALITEAIGDGWLRDAEQLAGLKRFCGDTVFLERLAAVKRENKARLAREVRRRSGLLLDPDSVFDVQVKRIHAYKRQLLNVLKIMDLYNRLLEDPGLQIRPHTFLFAGKASQSYSFAKSVIRLIHGMADVIDRDERVNQTLRVVFLEDFNVTLAEKIYPAADISEQISTAGLEASGTGNMKFMMNGAVTLGTADGANVEIFERVGAENMEVFGLTAQEIEAYQSREKTYNAWDEYHSDPALRRAVDQLQNGFFGEGEGFWEIYDSLLRNNDAFFVLKDFAAYRSGWEHLGALYGKQEVWRNMSLQNIAASGFFSSDRAIAEYARDIWKNGGAAEEARLDAAK